MKQYLSWQEVLSSSFTSVIVIADGYDECGCFSHYEPFAHDRKFKFEIERDDCPCCYREGGFFFYEPTADYYIENGKLYCDHPDLKYREPVEHDEEWEYLDNLPEDFWEEVAKH